MHGCLGMSKKMKEEGPMDNKKCFYDETVLTGKVKPQSDSKSQSRAILWWCLVFLGAGILWEDLLNADSHKAVIAVTHRCQSWNGQSLIDTCPQQHYFLICCIVGSVEYLFGSTLWDTVLALADSRIAFAVECCEGCWWGWRSGEERQVWGSWLCESRPGLLLDRVRVAGLWLLPAAFSL